MKFIRNWKLSLPTAGVALLGLAWLAFGYFGIHTAFIDNEVSEDGPVFDAVAADMPAEEAVGDPIVIDEAAETDAAGTEAAEAPAPENDAPTSDSAEATSADSTDTTGSADAAAQPEIVTEFAGQFSGTSRYDVSGDAIVLGNGTGQRFLRFENFESNNGPDLNVYLVNPDDPSDFIDLGDLKGNIGDQNYEIPADVDLDRYSQVSIWCVRFSVGFGNADLAPIA
ncbi:MAG: DM13 domain-containing protein [Actinomycetota bacterium]